MDPPTFVVLGHVNRGKSSVISTLAEDDSVEIDARPGTTRRTRNFRVTDPHGQPMLTLIDTPGFQQARQVLDWLEQRPTTVDQRPALVRQFVEAHETTDAFADECALLRPVVEGGLLIYVVDSSRPFQPTAEAEMTVLQWTGQPRIALINRIESGGDEQRWRQALTQYFNQVRAFNAHQANFDQRMELLRGLREVDEQARPHVQAAIDAISRRREQQRQEAAARMAETMTEVLQATEQKKLPAGAEASRHREPLQAALLDRLREAERSCQHRLYHIYGHHKLTFEQHSLEASELGVAEDLFSEKTWTRLGLSRGQLIAAGAGTGAAIGGGLDLTVGAVDFGLGAVLGGAIGGVSAWYGANRLMETKILTQAGGGHLLQAGPVTNRNFPWIVLDRLVLFHDHIAQHAHASRGTISIDAVTEPQFSQQLDKPTRKQFEQCFSQLRSRSDSDASEELTRLLTRNLQ